MILPVIIPARNEGEAIKNVITDLQNSAKEASYEPFIVVIDDGSRDDTADHAKKMTEHVIELEDRGYSALGLPELAETHNAGFKYIKEHCDPKNYDYIMVSGADAIYPAEYIKKLLVGFEDDQKLAVASGKHRRFQRVTVNGSGRIYRREFMATELDFSYPLYYSWESYPLYLAKARGWNTRIVEDAVMDSTREAMTRVDWARYGKGMYEGGFLFVYVIGRAMRHFIRLKIRRSYRLIVGYLSAWFRKIDRYPQEVRNSVRSYQIQRIKNII